MRSVVVLLIILLLGGCGGQNTSADKEPIKDCQPCQLSEKCIALLAYGLLSDDDNDVPLGGACEGVLSDSIITYLQIQKHIVNTKTPNAYDTLVYWGLGRDIALLGHLIELRREIRWHDNTWRILASNIPFVSETDYSFYWRLLAHGLTNSVSNYHRSFFNLDTLNRIAVFSSYTTYLDSLLIGEPISYGKTSTLSYWCNDISELVVGLRTYSKDDFLLKYYDIRCKNETLLSTK
jgi:hypothetical protein